MTLYNWLPKTVLFALAGLYFFNSALAADPIRRLDEYACLKKSYRVCEDLDDVRSILADVTQLNSSYVEELLKADINGFNTIGDEFSTFSCQVHLLFLARTLKSGLADVESDICAARDISEFVATNSWKSPASSFTVMDYLSTIDDSLQILDEIYLGDWAAIRSTEGSKTAQCFQSVTLLKELFSQAEQIGIVSKDRFDRFQFKDFVKLTQDRRTATAIELAQAAASGADGNSYIRQLIQQIEPLLSEMTADGVRNPLLINNAGDKLCAPE